MKLGPVIKEFQKNNKLLETKICITAQHRELFDQVLVLFEIKPDFDLNVMDVNQRFIRSVRFYKTDLGFAKGDTTTLFTAYLASFY
jgi:UDP-N-acetylglucosamine 2-epimerase (non-hydrolysing)